MTSCQRWRDRRASYRPAGELFDTARAEVQTIYESDAKRFVIRHHYAASYPAARYRVGLFIKRSFHVEQLAGVAVFSVPMSPHIIPRYFGGISHLHGVELGRLVLLDEVPANAESWFVARAFRRLRADLPTVDGVLAYSDPLERIAADGSLVKRGHIGTVYQALNASYLGLSRAQSIIIAPDGRIVSRRALSKLRNDECGAAYAYEQLRSMGAPARRPLESGTAYARRALAHGFRRERHPGNHTYTWWIGSRRLRPVRDSLSYPKGDTVRRLRAPLERDRVLDFDRN